MTSTITNRVKSPLNRHLQAVHRKYNITINRLEQRQPHIVPPWWTPPPTYIADDPELATEQHDRTEPDRIRIYSDASAIEDHVGAAAVAPDVTNIGNQKKKLAYMGKTDTGNIYAAELKGIVLALQIVLEIHTTTNSAGKCIIFVDNQASIRAVSNPNNPSGQYILMEAIQTLDKLRDLGWDVEFRWIASHYGVPGNEMADAAARAATGKDANIQRSRELEQQAQSLPYLIAPLKAAIRKKMIEEWETAWIRDKNGRTLFRLGVRPGKKLLKLHKGTHRAIASIITQMRTGIIGLRAYLHRINRTETDQCQCGYGKQTVQHVLLECRDWVEERHQMWAGKQPYVGIKKILCNPTKAAAAAKMMLSTGLLEQFQAVPDTVRT